jgi:hypothetical protein
MPAACWLHLTPAPGLYHPGRGWSPRGLLGGPFVAPPRPLRRRSPPPWRLWRRRFRSRPLSRGRRCRPASLSSTEPCRTRDGWTCRRTVCWSLPSPRWRAGARRGHGLAVRIREGIPISSCTELRKGSYGDVSTLRSVGIKGGAWRRPSGYQVHWILPRCSHRSTACDAFE